MTECGVCGLQMHIDDSDKPLVSRDHAVPAIVDAVEHVERHPTNTDREEFDLEYVFATAYYPGDHTHWINIADFPERHWGGALLDVQAALAKRGLMINSLDMSMPSYADVVGQEPDEFGPALHVVTADWYTERLPDGDQR